MSEPIKNIVLVGRTGNGKSATGNTLLGKKLFNSRLQAGGVTMECKMYRAAIQDGPIINVIDTPGMCSLQTLTIYPCWLPRDLLILEIRLPRDLLILEISWTLPQTEYLIFKTSSNLPL